MAIVSTAGAGPAPLIRAARGRVRVERVRGVFELSASAQDHAALLTACGRGDRAALRAIYEREVGAMIGVAQRILKRRELAEEIVHDAFVQIWRHAARY